MKTRRIVFATAFLYFMGMSMGIIKKMLMLTVGTAIAGFALYEVSKMMSKKASTGPGEMHMTVAEPRDPRDYRSIYDL